MNDSMCGANCADCPMNGECRGCVKTNGHPFGGNCMLAECAGKSGQNHCKGCGADSRCGLKDRLISEFNALDIADMPRVTELYALKGSFVNLSYLLPGGQKIVFWKDEDIYLGNQLPKKGSDRCYGLTTDGKYLLVCEYGENGSDPEIVIYKKLKGPQ